MSRAVSPVAQIAISGAAEAKTIPLSPHGSVVGRAESCDIVLDDAQVSRQHARLYQDPFERWIIEDLGSRNGTWVRGRRVTSQAVTPGERIVIGPFRLWLRAPPGQRIRADETATTTTLLLQDAPEEAQVQTLPGARAALSAKHLEALDAIGECLAEIVNSSDLYPEVCKCLAEGPETAAFVLRATPEAESSSSSPEVLACHPGVSSFSSPSGESATLRLSSRVIRAVLESGQPAMAGNVCFGGSQLDLTVADDRGPRVVCGALIVAGRDWTDILYVDMPAPQDEPDMMAFVAAVARQVGLIGQNLLQIEEAQRSRLLDQQLATARRIQADSVPKNLDFSPHLDVAILYEPALWVGGDYCDAWLLPDGRVAFALGDVSGKGLPAALVVASVQAALRTALNLRPDPTEAVLHLNRHLREHTPSEMFVTLFIGLLDPKTGRLEYLNAGHILPLLVRASRPVSTLGEPQNMPVGIIDATFVANAANLERGTALVLVSDGITEAASPEGTRLGLGQVRGLLEEKAFDSCQDLVRTIAREANEFRLRLPQQDDMTVLALRHCTPPVAPRGLTLTTGGRHHGYR